MNIRNVQIITIIILSVILVSPQVLNTAGFMKLEVADRNTTVPTAENDSRGIVKMDEPQNVTIAQDSEKLVNVTNTLNKSQEVTVDLEDSIPWSIEDPEGSTRTVPSTSSETYDVDTSVVDRSVSEGNYTVKMINGSFLVTVQRTIPLVEPDILTSERSVLYDGFNGVSEDDGEKDSVDNTDSPSVVGPPSLDLTGNGLNDIPYVDSSGQIKISDANGNTKTLVSGSPAPNNDKSIMAVGTWKGSPPSVFYAGGGSSSIYRVDVNGNTEEIATPSNGAQAVSGFGDIDDDGAKELTFVDSSQQLRYIDDDGTPTKIDNGGIGSGNGIGAGQLPDLDDDGIPRIVAVDGSNNILIAGVAEPTIRIKKASPVKSPVTVSDIDADDKDEILYIGSDNNYINYVDNPLSSPQLYTLNDQNGNPISGSKNLGLISG